MKLYHSGFFFPIAYVYITFIVILHFVPLPSGVYGIGTSGPTVVKIQKALAALGFNIVPDGIYGPVTSNVILNLQRKFPEVFARNVGANPNANQFCVRPGESAAKIINFLI